MAANSRAVLIAPDAPPPNRMTLSSRRIAELHAFVVRGAMPSFCGSVSDQQKKRDKFKDQAEIFFVPKEGQFTGQLCTSRRRIRDRAKKDHLYRQKKGSLTQSLTMPSELIFFLLFLGEHSGLEMVGEGAT